MVIRIIQTSFKIKEAFYLTDFLFLIYISNSWLWHLQSGHLFCKQNFNLELVRICLETLIEQSKSTFTDEKIYLFAKIKRTKFSLCPINSRYAKKVTQAWVKPCEFVIRGCIQFWPLFSHLQTKNRLNKISGLLSHLTCNPGTVFKPKIRLVHRDLEQMEPKLILLTTSEGVKLVILLYT